MVNHCFYILFPFCLDVSGKVPIFASENPPCMQITWVSSWKTTYNHPARVRYTEAQASERRLYYNLKLWKKRKSLFMWTAIISIMV